MGNRLILFFLLLFHLTLTTEQGLLFNSNIDFSKSDYDYEGCGTPGIRRRDKREYDYDEEEEGDEPQKQGFGGSSADSGMMPWAVAILKFGVEDRNHYTLCGGTLISRRHVLTAAHCLAKKDAFEGGGLRCQKEDMEDLKEYIQWTDVIVDGHCLFDSNKEGAHCPPGKKRGKRVQIDAVTLFPFFDGNCEEGDDLVILTLKEKVESNHACLPWLHDVTLPPSIFVQSFGWGESKHEVEVPNGPGTQEVVKFGELQDNVLQEFQLGKTDLRCTTAMAYIRDKICVPEEATVAVCAGDSGAGLLTTHYRRTYLLGVLSSGTDCMRLRTQRNEALFTDIRLFSATIDKTIGTVGPIPQ